MASTMKDFIEHAGWNNISLFQRRIQLIFSTVSLKPSACFLYQKERVIPYSGEGVGYDISGASAMADFSLTLIS